MADAKISQLPVASTPLAGTELVPVVQGGATEQTTVEAILTGTVPSGTANGVLFLDGSKVVTSGSALTFDGTNFRNTSGAFEGIDNMTLSALVSSTNATVLTLNSAGTSGTTRFQINGSEQMRLDSTGLGIGNSSPTAKLDVTGTAAISGAVTLSGGTANGVLYLDGSKVVTSGSALTFDGTSLGVGTSDYGNAGSINVAVGVPATATGGLQLWSTTSGSHYMQFGDATAGDGPYRGAVGYNHTLDALQFFASGSEKMVLTSTGLGIGTSSPTAKLNTAGNSSANQVPDIQITRSSSGTAIQTGPNLTFSDGTTNNTTTLQVTQGRFGVWNYGSGAWNERMAIDSSGNLGLGVTPSASWTGGANLQIGLGAVYANSSLGAYDVSYNSVRTASNSYVYAQTGLNATRLQQRDGAFNFFTALSGTAGDPISFTQAMTLDASGNLALGATSANARLDVVGGSIRVNEDSIGTKIITVRSDYAGLGPAINVTTSHPLLFLTGNTERVRIKSTGQLRFVPLAADPAGAEAGDVYYNSGTNKLRLYDGSTWVDLN
jgi:hypothetical protein